MLAELGALEQRYRAVLEEGGPWRANTGWRGRRRIPGCRYAEGGMGALAEQTDANGPTQTRQLTGGYCIARTPTPPAEPEGRTDRRLCARTRTCLIIGQPAQNNPLCRHRLPGPSAQKSPKRSGL